MGAILERMLDLVSDLLKKSLEERIDEAVEVATERAREFLWDLEDLAVGIANEVTRKLFYGGVVLFSLVLVIYGIGRYLEATVSWMGNGISWIVVGLAVLVLAFIGANYRIEKR